MITKPQNFQLTVDPTVKRMFVRMVKSPSGHRRHYGRAVHQQEGGSASPLTKKEKFTALLHHVSVELLRESFLALKRDAAPGLDGSADTNTDAFAVMVLQTLLKIVCG